MTPAEESRYLSIVTYLTKMNTKIIKGVKSKETLGNGIENVKS